MKTFFTTVILSLFINTTAAAQDSIKFPVAWFVTGAMLDNASTNVNLRAGRVESNPLLGFAHNDPTKVAVFAAATDTLTIVLSQRYAREHPKLVKTFLYIAGSIRFSFGMHNTILVQQQMPSPIVNDIHAARYARRR